MCHRREWNETCYAKQVVAQKKILLLAKRNLRYLYCRGLRLKALRMIIRVYEHRIGRYFACKYFQELVLDTKLIIPTLGWQKNHMKNFLFRQFGHAWCPNILLSIKIFLKYGHNVILKSLFRLYHDIMAIVIFCIVTAAAAVGDFSLIWLLLISYQETIPIIIIQYS